MNESIDYDQQFLTSIREASRQLQLEEFLDHSEQQILTKYLGIQWFQAKTFEQAKLSLMECRKGFANISLHHVALCKSLLILMDECYPLILLSRAGLIEVNLFPCPNDPQDLLERLRHHYLISLAYQNQIHDKYGGGAEPDYTFDITETSKDRIEKHAGIFMRHFEHGLRLTFGSMNMDSAHMKAILSNDEDSIRDMVYLTTEDRNRLLLMLTVVRKTKKDLLQRYQDVSKHLPLKNLAQIAPDAQEISQLIKSGIFDAQLSGNKAEYPGCKISVTDLELGVEQET